jgi:hypothetical protein
MASNSIFITPKLARPHEHERTLQNPLLRFAPTIASTLVLADGLRWMRRRLSIQVGKLSLLFCAEFEQHLCWGFMTPQKTARWWIPNF